MTKDEWFVIQLITAILAGICGFFAAILVFLEFVVEESRQLFFKIRLKEFLNKIRSSRLVDLPNGILASVTGANYFVSKWLSKAYFSPIGYIIITLFNLLVFYSAVVIWMIQDMIIVYAIAMVIYSVLYLSLCIIFLSSYKKKLERAKQLIFEFFTWLFGAGFYLFPLVYMLTNMTVIYINAIYLFIPSLLGSFSILYTLAIFLDNSILILKRLFLIEKPFNGKNNYLLFTVANSLSYSIIATGLSIFLGNIVSDNEVLITGQMFKANWICDLLSGMFFSALFFTGQKKKNVLLLIAVSFIISAAFSYLSLFFSLLDTYDEPSPQEILNTMFMRTREGNHWEIGPYFFLMHTTFIPIFSFLSILIIATCVKLWIKVVALALGLISQDQVNTFKAFAALLGIFVTLFSALSTISGIFKDKAPTQSVRSMKP